MTYNFESFTIQQLESAFQSELQTEDWKNQAHCWYLKRINPELIDLDELLSI